MPLQEGDIQVLIKLQHEAAMRRMDEFEKRVEAATGRMAGQFEGFATRTGKVAKGWTENWWKRFGVVALGFTVAYRAMNAFELGLRKLTSTITESIKESGELAGQQAKLAFWYQMHSKEVVDFGDAYSRAAANMYALQKASITSISALRDLATGMDEIAQAVGAVPARLVPAMADLVDFTVMVAQTTGNTTRQIRQEFQALFEGQMRTTNMLIRTLKNLRILTDEDIASLKAMTNRAEIFEKVLTSIHDKWAAVRDTIIQANVETAFMYWEKALRQVLVQAVQLTSKMEGVKNIFAEELAKAAAKFTKGVAIQQMERLVVLMQLLRDGLRGVLNILGGGLNALSYLAVAFSKVSDEAVIALKLLMGFLGLITVEKVILRLGKALIWLAMLPLRSVILVMASLGVAITFFEAWGSKLVDEFKEIGKEIAKVWKEHFTDKIKAIIDTIKEYAGWLQDVAKKIWEKVPEGIKTRLKDMIDVLTALSEKGVEKAKDLAGKAGEIAKDVGKQVGAAAKDTWTEVFTDFWEKLTTRFGKGGELLKDAFGKIMEFIEDKLDVKNIDIEKLRKEFEKFGKDLGFSFREGFESEAEISAAFKKLRGQIQREYTARAKLAESLQKKIAKLMYNEHDYEMLLLDLEVAKMKEVAGQDMDLRRRINIYHALALQDLEKKYDDTSKRMIELSQRTSEAMEQNFSDFYLDVIMGELDDFMDYFKAFNKTLARVAADMLGQLTRMWLFGSGETGFGAWPIFGGKKPPVSGEGFRPSAPGINAPVPTTVGHTGGRIGLELTPSMFAPINLFKNAPRLHQGTEYPAILELGEKVTPAGVAALERQGFNFNVTIVATDARSVTDLMHRNPQAVIEPFKAALRAGDGDLISLMRKI